MTGAGALRGRDEELSRLVALLDDRLLPGAVVSGVPGIGKTALVRVLLDAAARRGWDVRSGSARELEANLPFAAWREALDLDPRSADPRAAALAALLRAPSAASEDPGPRRWRVVDGVVDLLDAASRTRPVLVVLEDLHWADADSIVTAARCWRAARQLDLVVVVTTRPAAVRRDVAAAVREAAASGCLELRLEELSPAAVTAVATDCLGAPPGPSLTELLPAAGGNPLLLTELLALLRGSGALGTVDGVVEWVSGARRELPAEPLLARLDVEPRLRHLLVHGAVLGRRFRVSELAAVRRRPVPELWAALQPGFEQGLLLADGESVALRHDLLHEALYGALPADVRRAMHDDVAEALDAAGVEPERVGAHLERGTLSPSRARRLLDLAEDVLDRAPELALGWLGAARTGLLPGDPDRVRLQVLRARAAALGEQPRRAVQLARGLLSGGVSAATAAEVWATIAQVESYLGESSPETAQQLAGLLPSVPADHPRAARLHALAARALRAVGRTAEAVDVARAALAGADSDAAARCAALGVLARQALQEGDAPLAFDLADQGLETARREGLLLQWAGIEMVKDFGWVRAIDTSDTRLVEVCEEVIAHGEEAGLRAALPAVQAELAETLRFRGRWAEAEAHARAAVDGLDASRYATVATDAWFTLLLIASRRGDAAAFGNLPLPLRRAEADIGLEALRLAHAWALAHSGDPERAWQEAERARDWFETAAPDFMYVWAHPYVRLALARGEVDRAATFTERIRAAAGRMDDHPVLLAQVRTAEALLAREPARACAAARDALDLSRSGPVFPNQVDALLTAGEVLGRHGDRTAAVEALQECRRLAMAAGATVDIGLVDAALRRLGVRAHRPRTRATSGWGALTEVEARVVSAVAEGLTYREVGQRLYISRRTVETHVASAFRKTGCRSRHELAVAWRDRARP